MTKKNSQQAALDLSEDNGVEAMAPAIDPEDSPPGFVARTFALASIPHKHTDASSFTRRNGNFTLTVMSPPHIGLPYGSIPRVLLAWITTETARTGQRELVLGDSLAEYLRRLGYKSTGGRNGTIPRVRDQMIRLFSSAITAYWEGDGGPQAQYRGAMLSNTHIVQSGNLWWRPGDPDGPPGWRSTLTLGETFFEEITQHRFPIHMDALRELRRSPFALDIYFWLTYRMSYLKKPCPVPWHALQEQFGADYQDAKRFRLAFRTKMRDVLQAYPQARVRDEGASGIRLLPSPTHIAPRAVTI